MKKSWKHGLLTGIIATLIIVHFSAFSAHRSQKPPVQSSANSELEMGRAINIFRSLLGNANSLYVDSVKVKEITEAGFNAMLAQLDPYTEYMPESEREDFRFMTTGEYGGIGAYIQQLDSAVYVQNPMPGTPAEKAGLRMGDKFITIDGQSVIPGTASKVSGLLKGPVNTQVKVTIRRLGETRDRQVTLDRQNVTVDQVLHSGLYRDSIGYIRLGSFTDKSFEDVRRAYNNLLNGKKKPTSLVLDLRSNGGGVMDDAVSILSMFVPKGTMVVYTEGKMPQTSQKYYTQNEPIDTHMPVVVLINGGSASASEIVAGALQDLDRAVLVGTKSFGKGLVQTTRPIPYNGIIKVTIARYFIPSGRCIQQLDYSHRNPDGTVGSVPDSLTHTFKTKNGREVRDGGGIRPDIEIEDETLSSIVFDLMRTGRLFAYTNELYLKKKQQPQQISDVVVTDEDFEGLITYLEKNDYKYGKLSLQAMERLKELAEFEGYKEESALAFDQLKKSLTPQLRRDITPHKEQIKGLLRGLLASHYYGMNAQYIVGLESDPTFTKALDLLSDPRSYRALLRPGVKGNPTDADDEGQTEVTTTASTASQRHKSKANA